MRMIKIRNISVFILIIFAVINLYCKKSLDKKLSLKGMITDDITGQGITETGTVGVNGYKSGNSIWAYEQKENLGSGIIHPDGTYECLFSEWSRATSYFFWFSLANESYVFGTSFTL